MFDFFNKLTSITSSLDEEAYISGAIDNERAEHFRLLQEIWEAEALEQFSAVSSHSQFWLVIQPSSTRLDNFSKIL